MRKEGKEQEERIAWERARWMKFLDLQMNPNIKKGHKPSSPQSWIPFPWERRRTEMQDVSVDPLTEEEIRCLAEIFNIDREKFSNG